MGVFDRFFGKKQGKQPGERHGGRYGHKPPEGSDPLQSWEGVPDAHAREFLTEGLILFVQSSNIESIQYLSGIGDLRVKFHEGRSPSPTTGSGMLAVYHGVTPEMAEELLRASSKGQWVYYNLSSTGWDFTYEGTPV
jgi:hypothetical protein